MIVMVSSKGPSTGSQVGSGWTITVPQLEKIHTGTGKMTMVFVNGTTPARSAMVSKPFVSGVSGNIATIRHVSFNSGGLVCTGVWGSANMSNCDFLLIADGY